MMMIRVAAFFVLLCLTPVWAISYTVQVVAFSDEPRAKRAQAELAEQGYPAYLLLVPTAQGQVYRIRVGAFANRAAAALFATAMPSVEGSTPSPALAEGGVPQGFIPLEPALLGQYDLATTLVQVFPWPVTQSATPDATPQQASDGSSTATAASTEQTSSPSEPAINSATTEPTSSSEESSNGTTATSSSNTPANETTANEASTTNENTQPAHDGTTSAAQATPTETSEGTNQPIIAIRVQPRDATQPAHYRIGGLEFDAWKAAPTEDGWIVRVRSQSVWPENWQNASEAERDQFRETVLANVASDLDLTPQQVEPFVFELENKAPFVILVERFNSETQQVERLRAIGQPRPNETNLGLRSDGPSTFFGEKVEVASPDTSSVFEPSSASQASSELVGNGWQASADEAYVNLTVNGKTWRAANGQPVWASGDLLISIYENQVLIYQFQKP
jgi:SPOR domain